MGSRCKAGRRILVIDDQGGVYPCEPIWECIGNLRGTNYEILPILREQKYRDFIDKYLGYNKCNCTWGNIILDSIIYNPKYFPRIIFNMFKLYVFSATGIRTSKSKLVQNVITKSEKSSCCVPERKDLFNNKNYARTHV